MSVIPPGGGGNRRRPSLKGKLSQSVVRGVERSQAWPKKRGKNLHPSTKEQNEWFRLQSWSFKYYDARIQDFYRRLTHGSSLMPRDAMMMAAAGRLFSFRTPDGRIINSMAVLSEVSKSLDVITPEVNMLLIRGPDFWQAIPLADVAGGGATGLYSIGVGVPDPSLLTTIGGANFAFDYRPEIGMNVTSIANSATLRLGGWTIPVPAGDFNYAALMLPQLTDQNYRAICLGAHNTSNGRFQVYAHSPRAGRTTEQMAWWASDTSYTSALEANDAPTLSGPTWLHFKRESGLLSGGWSADGAHPVWRYSKPESDYVGTCDTIFVGMYISDGTYVPGLSVTCLALDPDAGSRVMGP